MLYVFQMYNKGLAAMVLIFKCNTGTSLVVPPVICRQETELGCSSSEGVSTSNLMLLSVK